MKPESPRTDFWGFRQHIPLGISGIRRTLSGLLNPIFCHILSLAGFWTRSLTGASEPQSPSADSAKSEGLTVPAQSIPGNEAAV